MVLDCPLPSFSLLSSSFHSIPQLSNGHHDLRDRRGCGHGHKTRWSITEPHGAHCFFPGDDLMRCVDLYNQAQSKWFEEMVTTTLELERLEVERVEMIRQHLCQYTQLRHETDMFNQSVSSHLQAMASRSLGDEGPGRVTWHCAMAG
uniref:Uncharacterized protein n=1 Tax=Castor canadensis TaxID=51338 RepID=A0A8C0WIY0_CASCN